MLRNSPVALAGLVTTLRALVWDQTWETSTPLAVRQVLDVVQELSLHSKTQQKIRNSAQQRQMGGNFNGKVALSTIPAKNSKEMRANNN